MFPSISKDLVNKRLEVILKDKNAPVEISTRLTSPHFITLNAKFRSKSKLSPIESNGKPSICFGVYVEKHLEGRAFRILDFMCKLLEHRGHEFALNSYGQTVVVIDSIQLHFNVRQLGKYIPGEKGTYSTREYITTDNLAIQAYEHSYSTKQWADAKIVKLEDKLVRVVAYLEVYADIEKKEKIKQKEWRRLYDLKLQQEKIIKLQRDEEKIKLEKLLKFSDDLDKAKKIEYYLNERREFLLSKNLFNKEEKEYYEWGIKKVAWLNPLLDEKDEPLDP